MTNSKELKTLLVNMSKAAGKNAVLPVIENLLIRDGIIYATDLINTLSTSINAPDGLLDPTDVIKFLGTKNETIEVLKEDDSYIFKTAKVKAKNTACGDAEDFPKVPDFTPSSVFFINNESLFKCFDLVGKDELRQAMTGVYIGIDSSGVTMCGTDAHRLLKTVDKSLNCKTEYKCILRPCTIKILKALKAEEIRIQHDGARQLIISFTSSDVPYQIYTTSIDARYPDFDAVIRKESDMYKYNLDIDVFTDAVKECLPFASRLNTIKLDINTGTFTAQCIDFDKSIEVQTNLSAPAHLDISEGNVFPLDGKLFLTLKIKGMAEFQYSLPTRPAHIKQGNDLYLLMPQLY